MSATQNSQPRSGLVTGARWALLILAAILTLGAFTQFILVGISYFDDPARWNDHAMFGGFLGLVTYLLWLPAILGKTGIRAIVASFVLLVLYGAQHAFMEMDSSIANALHAPNGALILVVGTLLTSWAVTLVRERPREVTETAAAAPDRSGELEVSRS